MENQVAPAQWLEEHEPRPKVEFAVKSYNPSDDEKKLVRKCLDLFQQYKKTRKKYGDDKWLDYYKMFRSKQWLTQRPSYRHSEVINIIWQSIQSQVPLMTDSRPKTNFIAEEPSDTEFAKVLDELFDSEWERNNWLFRLMEACYDARINGTAISRLDYKRDLYNGMGGTEYRICDPLYCFPDPDATDFDDASGFIYAEPILTSKLKKEYPDKAEFIKPDLSSIVPADRYYFDKGRYQSPSNRGVLYEDVNPSHLSDQDKTLKISLWLKDDQLIEEKEIKEGKEVYVQKKKYPKIRHIIIASNVLLQDAPIEYEDNKIPFSKMVSYIDPRCFWGISDIEPLESPQKMFNKLVSFVLDILTIMGNPIWIVDDSSNVDVDNLTNQPGLIVEKAKGSEVRREAGVQLQPYVLGIIDRLKGWFDNIAGATDVSRGVQPGGITAMGAIEALQEAAQTRERQRGRIMDMYMRDFSMKWASRVIQYYTVPRIVRITNDQNASKYFKVGFTKNPETGKAVAQIQKFDENTQAWGPVQEIEKKDILDVRASTGSSLPFAKAEKESRLKWLLEAGIIDGEEVLKELNYPNYEAVLERVRSNQQAQAAQQAPAA